ncbi:MAG: paraquat-inducible protein A [Gammaproteobacteria bacterium]|nr:paraquat-inducible protein A [Gammaproteobacteria bacterium]
MVAPEPHHHDLVACPDCDLLQRLPVAAARARLACPRCGCVLDHGGRDPVAVPLALGLTALILFVVSNSYPLLEFALSGQRDSTYLLAGIAQLYAQNAPLLASVVLFTTVLAPLLHIGLLIYIYLPLQLGQRPPAFAAALHAARVIVPWSMLEIFLLGVIVASVKLAEQASIAAGPAAWSLGLLIVVLAAASTQVHPQRLWDRVA